MELSRRLISASLTATPVDDTFPELTVSAPPTNEGLIGLPVTFTLSKIPTTEVSVQFDTVAGSAGPEQDYLPQSNRLVTFLPGVSEQTVFLTLIDDAITEPHETFSLDLKNPVGLTLPASNPVLTINNDDSVFDDYGVRFGFSVEERRIFADGDGDGIGFFLEYTFNLDPTVAESPEYVPGQTYTGDEEPTGLPTIINEDGVVKYIYLRRTDAYPWLAYFTELSTDGVHFESTEPTAVTPLTDHWEEVEVILSGPTKPTACFARVRVEAYEP